ncbi:MAG: HNH endonuclease [Candidatus Thorarchaeota archaeon]|jgi:5-methylcytosine-specific restriction endonuclease McrA
MAARYKATATIVWEFEHEGDSNPTDVAQAKLAGLSDLITSKVRIDRLRDEKTKVVWGEVDPDTVLSHITSAGIRKEYVVRDTTHYVRMNSHRYFIFASSRNCSACGLKGTKMLLEQHPNDNYPHFNLYGEENGELILMTKDHVIPKSHGGKDRHSNYQTMCCTCNNLKGSANLTLSGIHELRKLHNEYKDKVSSKELTKIIQDRTNALKLPDKEYKLGKLDNEFLIARSDILIVESDSDLIAVSVYDGPKEPIQLGCVSYGTILTPISIQENYLEIPFGDDRTFMLHRKFTNWKAGKCKKMASLLPKYL